MQMLAAGGMPVVHHPDMGYPSFETDLNLTGESLDPYDGHALKWLEPQHAMPPPVPFGIRTIWLTRDHREQARSAVKFMREVMSLSVSESQFRRSYDRDERAAVRLWRQRGAVTVVHFEHVLRDARDVAKNVAAYIGRELDIDAMVRQVRQRGPACLPYLLEVELINAAKDTGVLPPTPEAGP
jgi:hypothetical protein